MSTLRYGAFGVAASALTASIGWTGAVDAQPIPRNGPAVTPPQVAPPQTGNVNVPPVLSAPSLVLGNYYEQCKRSGRPGVDCVGGLAHNDGVVGLIGWAPCKEMGCVKKVTSFKITRVAPPTTTKVGMRDVTIAGKRTEMASGEFRGAMMTYAFGMSQYEDGVLIPGVRQGECFVASVELTTPTGKLSSESAQACLDDKVKWGTETVTLRPSASQGRSLTQDGCNKAAFKTHISPFDLRVGTQRYTGDGCDGGWELWSLLDFDLRTTKYPLVKAELTQPARAECIGTLTMINQNWEPDTGPISTNRPYDKFQTRAVTPSAAFSQDVTEWMNSRSAGGTGFQFSRPAGAGATQCIGYVNDMRLVVTRFK